MYGEWVNLSQDNPELSSVREAMASSNKSKWHEAMKKEMESLYENEVWNLVEPPKGRKIVGSKWVFKEKMGADGTTEHYKARLVAQGVVWTMISYRTRRQVGLLAIVVPGKATKTKGYSFQHPCQVGLFDELDCRDLD